VELVHTSTTRGACKIIKTGFHQTRIVIGMKIQKILWISLFLIFSIGCTSRLLKEERELGISPEALKNRIDQKQPIRIIDVRSDDEYYAGHLPGASFFPAKDIFLNVNQIPSDKEIILYCSDGKRSMLIAKHLHEHGYIRVRRLNGGIKAWSWDISH